jgi:haloalkane dehalogenase
VRFGTEPRYPLAAIDSAAVSVEAVRTADERFEGLPDFPFEPHYREVDGLRLAHLDEGEGPPVVFFHGEPTWSYLWRKVIPPVRDAGHRCIAPDYAGFGRSDKPVDLGWYSYDCHTDLLASMFEELDLRDATVVVHDWGGSLGMRIAAEHPERVSRIVAMDTGFFTGEQRMTEAWHRFRDFVERTEDLPVGMLVRGACANDPGDEVIAAYEAPFPAPEYKAGPRSFPLMLPVSPDMPAAAAGKRVLEAMRGDSRPKLLLWGDSDFIIPFEVGERLADVLGAAAPVKLKSASHFVQEDAGEEIGRRIAAWLEA